MKRRVLPGLPLSLGVTLLYLSLIVLLPVATLLVVATGLGPQDYWRIVSSERALASYRVTVSAAAAATLFNILFGLVMAWVLVRYEFPGRRVVDALVDLPFALPTAVAGISLAALLGPNGWLGAPLAAIGVKGAYSWFGIVAAMAFTSAPFVIRTVQPVLEDIDPALEEAAQSLGAGGFAVFGRVILPLLAPAILAGSSLAFARSLGEFGAVIFIAGNQPFETEIAALLVFIRLEEYNYRGAAAIASVILLAGLALLAVTNALQAHALRYAARG